MKINRKTGYVYFLKCSPSLIKVGFSTDIQHRVKCLRRGEQISKYPQKANLSRLQLIGFIPGSTSDEAKIQRYLKPWRDGSSTSREWFKSSSEVIEFIKKTISGNLVPATLVDESIPTSVVLNADVHRAVRFVCADLAISIQEFLRRAVARELAYNSRKVK